MSPLALSDLADNTLLQQLASLVARDRRTTAALLAHLGEVDHRKLYLPAACSSMHVYCVRVLHLSEDAALKRITAARAARRFPAILDAIADGRLHLSGVVMLAPHLASLTDAVAADLLAEAAHLTRAELEVVLARRFPRPDLPARITPTSGPTGSELLAFAPGRPDDAVAGPPPRPTTRTRPLSGDAFALQVTIDGDTRAKLERAQALLRHQSPSGDLAVVIDRALDALLADLERTKFAATDRPRRRRGEDATPADRAGSRHIPNEVKRAVYARDGERCAFVSDDGVRCEERGFLELDHAEPVARGGAATSENVRVRCRSHNAYEAERCFGKAFMDARRARAAVDAEALEALRALGFKAIEARDAMARSGEVPAATTPERLRAALAILGRHARARCSEPEQVAGAPG